MAIDTAEKRKSASGVGWLIPGVTPNSGKDQEWRQQAGWSYSGIAAAEPSGAVLGPYDVQAIELFVAGGRVREVFLAGKAAGAGQVFVAGVKLGEVDN